MYNIISPYFPWLIFLLGACVGSFLNVCIYRIPENLSVVKPRSCCRCGQMIAWYDNIPLLSWFILRGKARCCGQAFPFRYVLVEALTAFLFVLCWMLLTPLFAWVGMVFIAILIVSTFIDLDHMIIPDRFTVGGMVLGVFLSISFPALHLATPVGIMPLDNMHAGLVSLAGAFIGSGAILWLALITEALINKEAMGFGDVKLMGAIGAFCGWQGALFALFGGACCGALILALVMLGQALGLKLSMKAIKESSNQELSEDVSKHIEWGSAIPFGPWLALGATLYWLFFRDETLQFFKNAQDLIILQ